MLSPRRSPVAPRIWILRLFLVLTLSLGWASASRAALVLTSSTGQNQFAVFTLGPPGPGGTAVFRASDNALLYPGANPTANYASIATTTGNVPVFAPQSLSSTYTTAVGPTTSPVNSASIGNGTNFGSATVGMLASANLAATAQGNQVSGVGVLFTTGSFARASAASGVATVTISTARALFTNTGSNPTDATPGSFLNVTARLGSTPGSYVAVGLAGTLTVRNPGSADQVIDLGRLVMAYQGLGTEIGGLAGTPSSPLNARGTLSSALPRVTLVSGGTIEIVSTLTMIADPDSEINVDSGIPSNFNGTIPEFGAFAGGFGAVPEPSAWASLASGLAGVAFFAGRRRRRRSEC